MKKTIKKATRLTAFALSGAICLGSILWMPHMTAKAAIERQDDMLITGRTTGTLTIKKHGPSADIPLAGAGFSVYRVMELTPAEQPGDYAAYEKAAAFADVLSGVTADDLGNYSSVEIESLALELKAAAISADIQPEASGVTGEDGSCLFQMEGRRKQKRLKFCFLDEIHGYGVIFPAQFLSKNREKIEADMLLVNSLGEKDSNL